MNSLKNIKRTLKFLIIPLTVLLSFSLYTILQNKNKSDKENLSFKSEFYHRMYKEKDIDFIKNGELELKHIDKYLENFSDDILFCDFLITQKKNLSNEIMDKKISFNSKKDIEESENKKYEPIDYIDLYKQYCIEHHRIDKFQEFCVSHEINSFASSATAKQENYKE